jgi:hypothetical protein
MGYITKYSLKIEKDGKTLDNEEYENIVNDLGVEAFIYEGYWRSKWYRYRDDMLELSRKYPKHHFILEGEGEEPQDLWREHFYNGKFKKVKAQITFPPVRLEDLEYPDTASN